MDKSAKMAALVERLKQDITAETISALRKGEKANLGLVNHYKLHDLIPNKWFDWVNRTNARIMIIGQDWGPYVSLKRYVDSYALESQKPTFDYSQFLFSTFSSRTEKFIFKAVEQTYSEHFGKFDPEVWNDIIFTMAVLFTRQGIHFRGNHNFDPKQSAQHSYDYVSEQLAIVEPKIIITLGGMAFDVVNSYYKLGYDKQTVSNVISNLGDNVIHAGETIIIPNFHPASHTSPKLQLDIWSKIWEYYE